jgi:hypothetical protein
MCVFVSAQAAAFVVYTLISCMYCACAAILVAYIEPAAKGWAQPANQPHICASAAFMR